MEIVEIPSPKKNILCSYSAERTLCEILLPRANCDIQVITYAYKTYSKRQQKDSQKLIELSKVFKVEKRFAFFHDILSLFLHNIMVLLV